MAEGLGAEGLEDGEFRGRALYTDGHGGPLAKVVLVQNVTVDAQEFVY